MRASKQPKKGERSPDSEVTERGIAPGLEVGGKRMGNMSRKNQSPPH